MKGRRKLRVLVSVLCALALVVSNISPLSWGNNSKNEVKAADWDGLTELTWSDFGIACGSASNAAGQLVAGKEMNNSLFNGDVTMQAGAEIRYAGEYDWLGLGIGVDSDGNLTLKSYEIYSKYFSEAGVFSAESFGLKTFIGTKFNLKVAITDYTTTTDGAVATARVWVNDQMVGEAFELQFLSWCYCKALGNYMKLQQGTIVPDYALHELTWSDFGIACGSASNAAGQLVAGKEMNNSLFNGDVTMQAGAEIRYAGEYDWLGLGIGVDADGNLTLKSYEIYSKYFSEAGVFSAESFGLKTFIGTKFNLKVAITDYTTTTDGAVATARVWVNDQMVGEAFELQFLSWCYCKALGNYMKLQQGTIVPDYALHELTWSDFGIPCDEVSTTRGTLVPYKKINNSLFNGDITMQANSNVRYLGSEEHTGLIITVTDSGNLRLSTAASWSSTLQSGKEYVATTFDLETFVGTRFNLKIEVTEFTDVSAKVRIWVNDQLVEEKFEISRNTSTEPPLGTRLSLFEGTIEPHDASDETELHELTWSDFSIPCSKPQTSVHGQLVAGKEMNNSLFVGDITMQAGSNIRYGGSEAHTGLIIAVTNSGSLKLSTAGGWSEYLGDGKEFTAETYGLETFVNTRFNLKIAITNYTTESATFKLSVNDKLVGEAFKIKADADQAMGTRLSLFEGTVEPDYVLHELTWSDFKIPCSKPQTSVYGQLVADKEINNSLFNGDVTMQAGADIRYLGEEDYQALIIAVTESGALNLSTSAGWSTYLEGGKEFAADMFGLETFAGTRFNLKMAVTEYTGTSATIRIWINDQLLGEAFEISEGNFGTRLSLYQGTIEPDYILHELTWSDFNIPCNGQQTQVYGQLIDGKEINNSLFNGNVIMQAGSELRYIGGLDYTGLEIGVNAGGNLTLETINISSKYHNNQTEFLAETFGLDTFTNTRFNLKIAVTDYSTQSAMVRVWVNDQMVGEAFTLTSYEEANLLGTHMSFCTGTIDPSYTNGTPVPTGLADLTWEDFGFTCIGEYTADPDAGVYGKNGTLTTGKEMNNALFSGDVIMQAESEIRCIGTTDWTGLVIGVNANGDLKLSKAAVSASYLATDKVFSAETFGLASFANTKFNLKIAITDYSSASATIGIWVNDQMVGDYFTLEGSTDYPLGSYIAFRDGTVEPHSTIAKPTGLTEIHFGDWNAGVYDDGKLGNNELKGDVSHPDVDTLIGTSLKESVKFTGPGADVDGQYIFCWGGLKAEGKTWYGLRIDFVGDTMKLYKVNNDAYATSSNHFTLSADVLGIDDFSFYDREYLWQVDITQLGDNVLVWMYFDGILYGGAPIVMPNLASEMSDTMVFSPLPQVDGTQVERPATLGASDKTLSDLYHDLYIDGDSNVSAYIVPNGVVTMQKKTIVNGEITWSNMEVNGGDEITVAGDYKVTFNDGISNYIQEVVLFRSGDTKIDADNGLGSADLVRIIRKTEADNIADENAYKCEKWAYDVDGDYVVDTEKDSMKNKEVATLRKMILGTYVEDDTKMPIAGFAGPTGNMINDENYKKIQKAGITFIIENGGEYGYSDVPMNRYYIYEQLTFAQKYGMKMTVPDQRLIDMRTESVATIQAYLPEAIANYKDYQSFGGLFIVDEPITTSYPPYYLANNPTATKYSEYLNLAKAINSMEVDGEKLFGYSNGLGYCYQHVNDGTSPYQYVNYLNGIVDDYQNAIVTATYYPFLREHVDVPDEGSAVSGSDYFKHLALNRYVANESGKPLWTFVQAGDSFEMTPDDIPLSEGEFKWSANVGLAFGAKGIQYFSLMQPVNPIFHQSDMGLLDYTGAENEYYNWAIDVNKQLTAVDHILMNATSMGIMTAGGYATTQAADNVKDITLYTSRWNEWTDNGTDIGMTVYSAYEGATVACGTDTTYGILTGCFETADGKHALYIVNYNVNQANTVTVGVGEGVTATITQDGNSTTATGSANITIGAGEAVMVVF